MTKADDLWEKHLHNDIPDCGKYFISGVNHQDFLAALAEYGDAVRDGAVKVLEDNWFKTQSDCAAAIKGMKLP